MIFNIIVIILLLVLFVYVSYTSYEVFNTSYKQSNYSPNTNKPVPVALDKVTTYLSPDTDGNCPGGYERDKNDINSLCHSKCLDEAKFYNVDGLIHGCSTLDTSYNATGNNYPFAKDKKTNIVSPKPTGACPSNFKLDTKSGLCHTDCPDSTYTFYGDLGCLILNKEYSQTQYGTTDTPYLIAEDGKTRFVSPTSSGACPPDFMLDYASGLCYTACQSGTFYGTKSNSKIPGCR